MTTSKRICPRKKGGPPLFNALATSLYIRIPKDVIPLRVTVCMHHSCSSGRHIWRPGKADKGRVSSNTSASAGGKEDFYVQ